MDSSTLSDFEHFSWNIETVINFVATPIAVLVGLVGNAVIFAILCRKKLWVSLRLYFYALLAWNTLLLVSSLVLYTLPSLYLYNIVQHVPYCLFLMLPFLYMTTNVCFIGHLWTTVALTVERYMAICHPIRHRFFINTSSLALGTLGGSVVLSLTSIPRYFEIFIVHFDVSNETMNDEHYFDWLISLPLKSNRGYIAYRIFNSLVVASLGPMVILVYLITRMMLAIRRSLPMCSNGLRKVTKSQLVVPPPITLSINLSKRPRRLKLGKRSSRTRWGVRQSGPLLIGLLVTWVCHTLPAVCDLFEVVHGEGIPSKLLDHLSLVGNFLVVCSAALPFYMYMLSSARFRREVSILLYSWLKSDRNKIFDNVRLLRYPKSSTPLPARRKAQTIA